MAGFNVAVEALSDKRHIRRKGWGEGSTLYADSDNQLMRTFNGDVSGAYSWILDLNDLTAKDWTVVVPTSNHLQTTT